MLHLSCQFVILIANILYMIKRNGKCMSWHVIMIESKTYIGTKKYCTCHVHVLLIVQMLYDIGIGNRRLVGSCHSYIQVYPEKTYSDKGILHLSCQYVVFIVKTLYDIGIANLCLVITCHTSLSRKDILGQAKCLYGLGIEKIRLVMSVHTFLTSKD